MEKTDSSQVPVVKGENVYVPLSFFKTAYGASVTGDANAPSATIRMNNKALVMDSENASIVDNTREKKLDYNIKIFADKGVDYVPITVLLMPLINIFIIIMVWLLYLIRKMLLQMKKAQSLYRI